MPAVSRSDCDLFVERQGTLVPPVALLGKQTAFPTALTERREPYWQSSRSPIAALLFENAGDFVTTASATTVHKVPFAELIPITFNEQPAATGTPSAGSFAIMHVACVNVMQAFRACDLASARERGRWRVRFIEHFEIGMEGGEMPRHIRPKILHEPLGCTMQLIVGIVFARNQERGDFKPYVRFVS